MAFPLTKLDPDALAVVYDLQDAGHVAYLVGGCVRDLLLNRSPKDFDIATTATPEEIKGVFGRRCRIIGRRFTLAHVRFGPNVYEVATFRGPPDEQETADDASGFVVRANTYGSPEEDAHSRDFTVNGLFYDPRSGEIQDFVGGHADLQAERLVTIGPAVERLREDPVRLLRAIKFATRLGFSLDDAIVQAAPEAAQLLTDCPVARVTEEIFRILESGHLAAAVAMMGDLGVLSVALPELHDYLATAEGGARWETWAPHIDRLRSAHGPLPRETVYTLMQWPMLWQRLRGLEEPAREDWGQHALDMIEGPSRRMGVPVRYRQRMRATANVLRRLRHPHRRRLSDRMLMSPSTPLALTIERLEFLTGVTAEVSDEYERWAGAAERFGVWPAPFSPRDDELPTGGASRGTRPARRRRRRGPRTADGGGTPTG